MEQIDKIKITQKEIDGMFEIEIPQEVKEEIDDIKSAEKSIDKAVLDTVEPFLTEEEEQHDVQLHQDLPQEEDK